MLHEKKTNSRFAATFQNNRIILAKLCTVGVLLLIFLFVLGNLFTDIIWLPADLGLIVVLDLFILRQTALRSNRGLSSSLIALITLAIFVLVYLIADNQLGVMGLVPIHAYYLVGLISLGFWLHPTSRRFFHSLKMATSAETKDVKTVRRSVIKKIKFQLTHFDEMRSNHHSFWWTLAIFAIIVAVYVTIRLPYYNDTFFISLHPGKYVSYVPAAQEMYSAGNPFVFRNPAYTGIFETTQDQQYTNFWRMPFLEWTMAPFFSLSGVFTTEAIVRIYLTILGVIFLVNLFVLVKKIFSQLVSFSIILLFVFTPLFNLLTWTTTLDLPAMIFLLVAVNLLLYNHKNLAFVFLGFAFLNKVSFILIGLTLFGFLVLFTQKDRTINLIKLGVLSFAPLALFKTLLQYLPSHPDNWSLNLFLIAVFIIALIGMYLFIAGPFTKFLMNIQQQPRLWKLSLVVAGLIFIVLSGILMRQSIQTLGGQFLTDSQLLFNLDFYSVLFERINFMGLPTTGLLFLIAITLFWSLPKNKKFVLISFLLASLVFLFMASKSIRFAWYYNHIFIITMLLFIGGLFFQIEKMKLPHRFINILIVIMLVFFSLHKLNPSPSYVLANRLDRDDIQQLSQLISTLAQADEKIITYVSEYRTLFLYTGNPFVSLSSITDEKELVRLRSEINALGFYSALRKNNINLMIDKRGQDNFISLTYLFTDDINQISKDRTDLILSKLYDEVDYYNQSTQQAYSDVNVKQYFRPTGAFNDITIYQIVPNNQPSWF